MSRQPWDPDPLEVPPEPVRRDEPDRSGMIIVYAAAVILVVLIVVAVLTLAAATDVAP